MATYKIIGARFLRKYTADEISPVYAAALDAQAIVANFCNVPWEAVQPKISRFSYHTESDVGDGRTGLDENVVIRDSLDAAMFCADHKAGMHRAYAQAACYRFSIPTSAQGASITSIKVNVSSDPYNSGGCRVSVFTNDTGEIPMNCNTVRTGAVHADGVMPRTSSESGGQTYWYAAGGDVTLTPDSAITLGKYLFVFLGLENYSITRGNWLEGCATLKNLVEITTAADVTGWTDGETYDLSAGTALEYNVVKDGVYPDIRDGYSGVDTIQLQRSGEELKPVFAPGAVYGTDGLRTLNAGVFAEWLDVKVEEITCIQEIVLRNSDPSWQDYKFIAIGGTFSSGTFAEIPGLYFYDLTKSKFVEPRSLNDNPYPGGGGPTVPSVLSTIASGHGGFAAVGSTLYNGTNIYTNGLFFIACDGFTWSSSSSTLGIAPFVNVGFANGDSTDVWFLGPQVSNNHQIYITEKMGYGSRIEAARQVLRNYSNSSSSANCSVTITVAVISGGSIYLRLLRYVYGSGSDSSASNTVFAVDGTINAIRPVDGIAIRSNVQYDALFAVCGELSSVDSQSCSNVAIIEALHSNYSTMSVSIPAWDADITPSTYEGFMVSGGCSAPGYAVNDTIIISGMFNTLGGNTSYSKIAKINSAGNLVAISHPAGDTIAAKWCFVDSGNAQDQTMLLHGEVPQVIDSGEYYTNLHTETTDSQSAIGLRTLYARVFNGTLKALAVDNITLADAQRPGALFTVRGDTVSAPTGEGNDVDVPTWQVTTAKLVVPFAVPTAFRANKIKLDWTALTDPADDSDSSSSSDTDVPTATAGSKLNVWLKRGEFVTENPKINDPAIYDASKSVVDGWELVGVINAVGTSTATFDLFEELGGRVATLMFTAYINLDLLNPSSSMVLPQGVGIANVNGVDSTVSGIYTGWKPDITLIG